MSESMKSFDQRFEHLKKQAEGLLKDNPDFGGNIDTTHDLLHELQVYQAELEIQNEELRASQELLIASRDRFSYLYHEAPVGYVTVNREGVIREANAKLADMLGVDISSLIGKPLQNFIYPGDRDVFLGRYRAIFNSPEGKEMELRMEQADHSVLHALIEARRAPAERGKQDDESVLIVISDVTEKVRSEASLRLSEKVIETAHDAVIITDTQGTILRVNPAFELATGYREVEAIGKNPRFLQSGRQDAQFYKEMWSEILLKGSWQGIVWNRRKDGSEYAERLSISAIRDSRKEITHFVGVFSDITEQLELEESLRQAQKMEAIGTLVGGIAHDFNNMLAGINGNLYLAKRESQDRPNVMNRLNQIEQLGGHAADLISYMLTFARKDMLRLQKVSLNKLVNQFINGVARVTLPENIKLNVDLGNDPCLLLVDATKIQQVLLNLFTNAKDAVADVDMPEITLKLERFQADDLFALKHQLENGQELARLSIIDNGSGIDKDIQKKIFEPFYTNKEVGKGTGLGLAMVYGAIESAAGFIELESSPNKGAVFHIYLPVIEGDEPEDDTVEVIEVTPPSEKKTILMADDDDILREVVWESLLSAGYEVVAKRNGTELLDYFKEHAEQVNLVLIDLVMPGMGGGSVSEMIRDLSPEVPILFMTGFDRETAFEKAGHLDHSKVITKPFSMELLYKSVEELTKKPSK